MMDTFTVQIVSLHMLQKLCLKKYESICENHDYCYVKMPKEDNRIFKHNHAEKSIKAPFVIHANLEFILEKISTCHSNSEKSSITKINNHTVLGYSLFTCTSFDTKQNKLDCYRGEDSMKRFCKDLKEHATRIINYEKKSVINKRRKRTHRWAKICHICKKEFSTDDDDKKKS